MSRLYHLSIRKAVAYAAVLVPLRVFQACVATPAYQRFSRLVESMQGFEQVVGGVNFPKMHPRDCAYADGDPALVVTVQNAHELVDKVTELEHSLASVSSVAEQRVQELLQELETQKARRMHDCR